jgi:hypothetical protein
MSGTSVPQKFPDVLVHSLSGFCFAALAVEAIRMTRPDLPKQRVLCTGLPGQVEMSALTSDGSVGESSFLVENYFWQPAFKKPRRRSLRFRSMDILKAL